MIGCIIDVSKSIFKIMESVMFKNLNRKMAGKKGVIQTPHVYLILTGIV